MKIQNKAGVRMNNKVTEGNYMKFGVQRQADGMTFTFAGNREDTCAIIFYDEHKKVRKRIETPAQFCRGAVRSVHVSGLKSEKLYYNYEINGQVVTDAYAPKIAGREKWMDENRKENEFAVCGSYENTEYVWEQPGQPEIKKGEMVMYKLHVRGFSMDAGLRGGKKGTFAALEEKIPYLKKLGVTTLELMPVYEFEEMERDEKQTLPDYLNWETKETDVVKPPETKEKISVNYWGYTKGFYFAPKASYSYGKNAALELKHLVDRLHQNGMECVMEFYFQKEENQNLILDALRYWAAEFHIDGFHLIGENVPVMAIAQDLYLKRTKIFCPYIPETLWNERERYPHLFLYNEEYLYAGRKLLNHCGGTLWEFANQQRKQNETIGFVNFLTNNNGFTLADLFSYCEKHNEENGENNADGPDYNFSINCGAEGKSTRKYVKELRRKHIYMAFGMLFFAQGVPLFLAGDEFENSQNGNNNAYCQDNKTGWINWKNQKSCGYVTEFVEKLAAFRRAHPVIRMERPMQFGDYLHKGSPELSYHSDSAWITQPIEQKAAFGMMYNGDYVQNGKESADDYVYIGYNFLAGQSELALPKPADKKKWYLVMDTAETQPFLPEEKLLENQHKIIIKPQSVIVLLGK